MTVQSKPLSGMRALVTGGGTGIGAAVASELARLGADLMLFGRRPAPIADRRDEIEAEYGVECHAVAVDVTDVEALNAVFRDHRGGSPMFDILINNVGAAGSASFLKTDTDLLERMFAANFKSAFICTQSVLPAMLKQGSGRIVNVASTAGLKGYAYVTAYCAAKHALIGLTKALSAEVKSAGITVNAVCPGYTDTDLVDQAADVISNRTGTPSDVVRAGFAAQNPGGRLIMPSEVAAAVGWLCLPEAAAVTGQALIVAGGEL